MQAKPKKRLIAAFAGPNRAFKVYLDYMAQSLRMAKATIH